MKRELAYFISPHGFGHATRAIAVLLKLQERIRDLDVHLITTSPRELFNELSANWTYHRIRCDIGLVQNDAFMPDIPATAVELGDFLPLNQKLLQECMKICKTSSLILSDISPLGVVVADRLDKPGVLIENFTWDWIYAHLQQSERLHPFIPPLETIYNHVAFRVQTEPLCKRANCDLSCGPIARPPKTNPEKIKQAIGCGSRKIVFMTMGGIPSFLPFNDRLKSLDDYFFIIAGQNKSSRYGRNVLYLSYDTPFYHPDLIAASDLVVCKSGYSTIAECSIAGACVCSIGRPGFAESDFISQFVRNRLGGSVVEYHEFINGSWLDRLETFLLRITLLFKKTEPMMCPIFLPICCKAIASKFVRK